MPSPRKLIVEFTKMDGAGNDFVVLDNRFYRFAPSELYDVARTVCPRRTGIGADGLLALDAPGSEDVDFRMVYINADGSRGTMCGNGARCLAWFARAADLGSPDGTVRFETDAGHHEARVTTSAMQVALTMPEPRPVSIHPAGTLSRHPVHEVWTGTEHVVVFVEGLDRYDVAGEGPDLRHHPRLAPAGANVNFATVSGPRTLQVRTYEKGVEAEPLACGTGAVAVALAAAAGDYIENPNAEIVMPGGTLHVAFPRWTADGPGPAVLTGAVRAPFRGSFEWPP